MSNVNVLKSLVFVGISMCPNIFFAPRTNFLPRYGGPVLTLMLCIRWGVRMLLAYNVRRGLL